MRPYFTGQKSASPRKEYGYFLHGQLQALRVGKWKLRLVDEHPQLFNLQADPGEHYNRAETNPEIVNRMRQQM